MLILVLITVAIVLVGLFTPQPVAGDFEAEPPSCKPAGLCEINSDALQTAKLSILLLDKLAQYEGRHGGQCVVFIQRFFDVVGRSDDFTGSAKSIQPNIDEPKVGNVVLLDEGQFGHVALIINIYDDILVLAESNYRLDEVVTVGRTISVDDERVRGYYEFDTQCEISLFSSVNH